MSIAHLDTAVGRFILAAHGNILPSLRQICFKHFNPLFSKVSIHILTHF